MEAGVGSLAKIVGVALQIKEAADTARQNKEDCDHVVSRVDTLHKTLLQLEENAEVMETAAVRSALERADRVLADALRVVKDCQQEERSIVCVFFAAGKLSKELSKVDGRITGVISDITGAVQAYLTCQLSKQCQPLPVLKREEKISKQLLAFFLRPTSQSGERKNSIGESSLEERKLLSLPQQIIEVAQEIKEAAKTARWNKADFMEIEKRASSVSTLLSLLESYKELVKQETMRGALKKLLGTFDQAHTLVMAYRRISIDVILWKNGDLVKRLREVLDQMLGDISVVNLIVMHSLHCIKRHQEAGMVKDHVVPPTQDDLQGNKTRETIDSASATEYKSALVPGELITN